MFIYVMYKDPAELSNMRRNSTDVDTSTEKTVMVNPVCHVKVMLEYIRKVCNLGIYTVFDLCDENGIAKGLLNMKTFEYANHLFENESTYYIIVFRTDSKRKYSILPQLHWENALYNDLMTKVKNFLSMPSYSTPTSAVVKSSVSPSPQATNTSNAGTARKGKGKK